MVRGACVLFLFTADERAVLHARHVVGVGAVQIASRELIRVELDEDALLDGLLAQRVDEHFRVKRVRVVVVELAALLVGQLVVALVIAVVGDQAHFILAKTLLQPKSKGGLAAAGAACNANDQIIHRGPSCIILPLWVEKGAGMDYNRCKAACPGHSAGRVCSCTS